MRAPAAPAEMKSRLSRSLWNLVAGSASRHSAAVIDGANLDIKFVPITNLPLKQVTILRPRVKADATDEPIRIMGPSGPEKRQEDTVTIVPNSFTNTVLKMKELKKSRVW